MQPLLTQVPPNRLRSIIATLLPVSASRTARDGPAWPVPITIASYVVAIGHTSASCYVKAIRVRQKQISLPHSLWEKRPTEPLQLVLVPERRAPADVG